MGKYSRRYAILGVLFGLAFPIISSFLWVYQQGLALTPANLLHAQVNNPLQWIIDSAPLFLALFAYMAGVRQDRVTELNQSMQAQLAERSELVTELETTRAELEQIVTRQVGQLKAAAQVAREAATIRDLEELLGMTVNLISERLGFYHAGIFLLDSVREYAVLRAASSQGGLRMLARQHKLKVGEVGLVGHVAGSGEARIALDVGTDAVYFNNPDLPLTRSEMALPLKTYQRVIGVLDVQSQEVQAFTEEDLNILQILADQIALAIENARLLSESQQALRELQSLYRLQENLSWKEYLDQHQPAYHLDLDEVRPAPPGIEFSPAPESDSAHLLRLPISMRGQQLGQLVLQREADEAAWNEDEKDMVRTTLNQVALALENARLLEKTRRDAMRERVVTDISAQLWASTDIHTILRTALLELGQTLESSEAFIQLDLPAAQEESGD